MVNVNFFTYLLIYLCKSKSQKVFAQFTDGLSYLIDSLSTRRNIYTSFPLDRNTQKGVVHGMRSSSR